MYLTYLCLGHSERYMGHDEMFPVSAGINS